jgi:RNA polymerase sigma factor (sigma-70 family)
MMQDEDALSFVAEHLMIGAHRWDETRGRSLHSYLNQCAIWCIKRWVKIHKANPHGAIASLNEEAFTDSRIQMYEITADDKSAMPDDDMSSQEDSIELASLIDKAGLTERQLHCIEVVYIKGQRPTEVARDLGISRQAVDQCLTKGIRKLRSAIDEQKEVFLG